MFLFPPFYSVLVFREKGKVIPPLCFFLSKSHEYAGKSLPQRTASDFENAVPSIWFQINNSNSWDSVFVSTPYGIRRFPVTFLSAPDGGRGTGGLWQSHHSSRAPLPRKAGVSSRASPKSVGEREQVSLSTTRSRHTRLPRRAFRLR